MNAIDTNVLVYTLDHRFPDKRATAIRLVESLRDGVIVWQVACEFIAVCRKLSKGGISDADAWEQLARLLKGFELALPNRDVLAAARTLHLDSKLSYWDALLIAACREAGATRLFSEVLPGRAVPGIEIVNPFKVVTP